MGRDGWDVPVQNLKALIFWKSILSNKSNSDKWIRYRVHDGQQIQFWQDGWCGQTSLKSQFPFLYALDMRQQVLIAKSI